MIQYLPLITEHIGKTNDSLTHFLSKKYILFYAHYVYFCMRLSIYYITIITLSLAGLQITSLIHLIRINIACNVLPFVQHGFFSHFSCSNVQLFRTVTIMPKFKLIFFVYPVFLPKIIWITDFLTISNRWRLLCYCPNQTYRQP